MDSSVINSSSTAAVSALSMSTSISSMISAVMTRPLIEVFPVKLLFTHSFTASISSRFARSVSMRSMICLRVLIFTPSRRT